MNDVPADGNIERVLQKHGGDRPALIPILQGVQEVDGFPSVEAGRRVAEHLLLSANDVYGVATFCSYSRFNRPGRSFEESKVRSQIPASSHVSSAQRSPSP